MDQVAKMENELTEEDREMYRDVFNMFDKDNDGAISVDEMENVMRNLGHTPTQEELDKLIAQHDNDNSGQIEFEEFCQMMHKTKEEGGDDNSLERAFKLFDTDESGSISFEELKELMAALGNNLTDEELRDMIDSADIDGDGQISFEEFKVIFASQDELC